MLFTAYAIVRTVPSANRPNRRKKNNTCLHSGFLSCVTTVDTHVNRVRLLELHGLTGRCSWLPVLLAVLLEGVGHHFLLL